MGTYFEAGVGRATSGKGAEMGRKAATEALEQLKKFKPCLALLFISPELDIEGVAHGVVELMGDCPVIGTSTAGEIANGLVMYGVVVTVIASSHLKARVGMGEGVSRNLQKAVDEALGQTGASGYFSSDHPLHQMLHISSSSMPGVSPAFLILFSPGATKNQPSLSHDIHTMLRKGSANRLPIFGGSSGDYLRFESNYQIINTRVASDAIVLAFLESEIIFGLGMAHGFSPTTKRALVTRAFGHIVHELDGRPAAQVCAELLGMPLSELGEGAVWFSRFPFGATDAYGNSTLQVPEKILGDGSIQFGPLMSNDQVITLMRGSKEDIIGAGLSAFNKAVNQGGLKKPALALMFSCALRERLLGKDIEKEIALVRGAANIPVAGFYTFGEQGISDDGLPVYSNQSVSTLVFSDELNPIAALIHKGKHLYHEFSSRLERKTAQIKAIGRINQAIQDCSELGHLLITLTNELASLLPWADCAFYLCHGESRTYTLAGAIDRKHFPYQLEAEFTDGKDVLIHLDSHGKRFGLLILRRKNDVPLPDEEDMVLAETIGKLTASGLHRLELDQRLEIRLQQMEIVNRLGDELSRSISTNEQSQNIVKHIRSILKLSIASLWLVDRTHHLLIKEAIDGEPGLAIGENTKEYDEQITKWQVEHAEPIFSTKPNGDAVPIKLPTSFPYHFVSLPIFCKGQLRGILNLYSQLKHNWSFQHDQLTQNIEFLKTISTQVAVFLENRSIHKDTTFYKEIHHRVKNNLQNIASLLRMQVRRLDRVSAEQALSDSISRIMSIALVHETLSMGEIGLIDLGRLVGRISKLPLAGQLGGPIITLDTSGPLIMIPSREATSLALVINEVIQNAVQHGFRERNKGKLSIRVEQTNGFVTVIVEDDGPGLPSDFDVVQHGNLGLTIVRTLVKDELKGQFVITGEEGTMAKIGFPLPQSCYPIQ